MDTKPTTEVVMASYVRPLKGTDNSQADIFKRLLTAFVSRKTGKPVTELTAQHDRYADDLLSKLTSKADDPYLRAEINQLAQQASVSRDDLDRLLQSLTSDDDTLISKCLKSLVLGKEPTSLLISRPTCTKTNYAARMRHHIAQQQRNHPSGALDL